MRFSARAFKPLCRWAARAALAVLLALVFGCGDGAKPPAPPIPPAQKRYLSIAANPRPVPPPTQQDFVNAFDLAYNAGARGQTLTYPWSSLEPQAGAFSLQDLTNGINFSTSRGIKQIMLGIQVLNTVPRETPPDLLTVGFNTQQMKDRFHALLDAIRPSLKPEVTYLSIGNEVDVYLAAHPAEWATYKDFYEDAKAYVHQTMPGVKVGVTATFGGAAGPDAAQVATLTSSSDVYILTYYPLGDNFITNGPQSPLNDFPRMVNLAGSRPLVLQEVGYPASTLLSSSESDQAQFVTNVFQTWQAQGSKIPYLSYFLLHDFTEQDCSFYATYYGISGANFEAYLCTLGLRRVDGSAKPSWQALVNGAASIGLPE